MCIVICFRDMHAKCGDKKRQEAPDLIDVHKFPMENALNTSRMVSNECELHSMFVARSNNMYVEHYPRRWFQPR